MAQLKYHCWPSSRQTLKTRSMRSAVLLGAQSSNRTRAQQIILRGPSERTAGSATVSPAAE